MFQRLCGDEHGVLYKHGWLNDEIIQAYASYLCTLAPDLKVANAFVPGAILQRNYSEALRHLRYLPRQGGRFGEHKHLFVVFNDNNVHWTAVGINTVNRSYTYYDYMKTYTRRAEHMAAVHDFLQHVDSLATGSPLSPWVAHLDGTADMVTQANKIDCGVGVCFIIAAVSHDIPLSVFTVDEIYNGRWHIANCFLARQLAPWRDLLRTELESAPYGDSSARFNIFHPDYHYDPYQAGVATQLHQEVTIRPPSLTDAQRHEIDLVCRN